MLERRHAKGVTRRASRGNRNNRAARRVRDPYPALGGPRVAGDCPHRGSGGRGRVVSPDLSYREEGRARMDAITLPVARCTLPVLAGLAVAAPLAGQTSLSIYTDGRVVVRRTLPQALEKGRNTFTLKLEDLDPATLFSPDSSVALVSGVARPATDRDAALQHAVGQALTFVRQRADGRSDTVRATVVRVNPPQYRLTDGRFVLSEPGEPLFPAALVGPVPEAAVVLEAARARPPGHHGLVPTHGGRLQSGVRHSRRVAVARLSGSVSRRAQPRARAGLVHAQAFPRDAVRRSAVACRHRAALSDGLRGPGTARGGGTERPHRAGARPAGAVGGGVRRDCRAVQTDYNQEQLPPPRRGLAARQRITAAYKVMITNAKPEAVTVDVRESRSGVWQIVESSVPAEKLSATEIRFRVPVPATGTATLSYTVQAES